MKRFFNALRHGLLKSIAGKSPVMINMTIHGTAKMDGHGGLIHNNMVIGDGVQ